MIRTVLKPIASLRVTVVLFAVTIDFPQPMRFGLSPAIRDRVPPIARMVVEEIEQQAA